MAKRYTEYVHLVLVLIWSVEKRFSRYGRVVRILSPMYYYEYRSELPSARYLRMDGSVPSADRFRIVQRFNGCGVSPAGADSAPAEPPVECLLLTTAVGGHGLNLTAADTVILVEHDWNPVRDLQAIDRAHRIGQKRVVHVYRLIARGTIEHRILGWGSRALH